MPNFSEKNLSELRTGYLSVGEKADNLLLKFVAHRFTDEKAKEYAHQGFARRIGTLKRCIQNLFEGVPPDTIEVPGRDELHDAQINLQAFLANVYGSADNLAWVWVYERGLATKIKPRHVGLREQNTLVSESFSIEFQAYLKSLDTWFEYLADYRHALAHRIPLYIPPGGVRPSDLDAYNELQRRMNEALNPPSPYEYERLYAEQSRLFVFQPLMAHSLNETKGVVTFHPQVLADFNTIEELALKMLIELIAS